MKPLLILILAQLVFATSLRSQTPSPSPSADRIVVAIKPGHPELVPYKTGMKFSEAIMAAGGLTEFADIKHIFLIRCGKKEAINLKILRSDPTKEPTLEPWDILYLPSAVF